MHFSVLLSFGILASVAIQTYANFISNPHKKHHNLYYRKRGDIVFDFTAKRVRIGEKTPKEIPLQTTLPFPLDALVIKQGRGTGTVNYVLNPTLSFRLQSVKVMIKKLAAKGNTDKDSYDELSGPNSFIGAKSVMHTFKPRNKRQAFYSRGDSAINGHGWRSYDYK